MIRGIFVALTDAMNRHIEQLYKLAQKPERRIIGLMSGTSLDGLDIALCRISGSGLTTTVTLEQFTTVAYADEVKQEIRSVFARDKIDFQHLVLLNPWIGRLHGQLIINCLAHWNINSADVDLVASHGQTVLHVPKSQHRQEAYPNATLQIGDGDHIAAMTGIITLSDFRQKHIAHGGEGAPLAVYGDYFIFSKAGENRILLNMGGIANFTYLPGSLDTNDVFTTDTGPGNTLLDAVARQFFDKPYDNDGQIAATGTVNADLLLALKQNAFFDVSFPKTTGPEVFNLSYVQQAQEQSNTHDLTHTDIMATLTRFSAETIADAVRQVIRTGQAYNAYMSGGGIHNPVLVDALRLLLPECTVGRTDELGIPGDAKEAVLFAVLANEAVAGGHTSFGNRQGVPSVTMGKVSFPK